MRERRCTPSTLQPARRRNPNCSSVSPTMREAGGIMTSARTCSSPRHDSSPLSSASSAAPPRRGASGATLGCSAPRWRASRPVSARRVTASTAMSPAASVTPSNGGRKACSPRCTTRTVAPGRPGNRPATACSPTREDAGRTATWAINWRPSAAKRPARVTRSGRMRGIAKRMNGNPAAARTAAGARKSKKPMRARPSSSATPATSRLVDEPMSVVAPPRMAA